MVKISTNSEYFSVKDTLCCGQIFRFFPCLKGYKVFSLDKCAYCYNEGKNAFIECEDADAGYFYNFFDLGRDYKDIVNSAKKQGFAILEKATEIGKGIRILNQDKTETLFSFIVSQNNNIPRIKKIIERLCLNLGEKKQFMGEEFYSFPTVEIMAQKTEDFYKDLGLGYRAPYIKRTAEDILNGLDIESLSTLSTDHLKKQLTNIYGVGPKVADCVSLFGYHRSDSFPVDTWLEKVYREDFNGQEKNRNKITEWFTDRFKNYSGYYQQYLFFYKRLLSGVE